MKYLTLIPLAFLSSCASHPKSHVAISPAPPPAVESPEATRYADVVQTYHVGRYVDPNYPGTMHEQHPIYRIENSARWDLHPSSQPVAKPLNPSLDSAYSQPPTNDAIIAEMYRQREATERVMKEATRLGQSFSELQAALNELRNAAQNDVLLAKRLSTAEQRITDFEKALQKLNAPANQTVSEAFIAVPVPPKP
jgi:hypothetical protein